MFASSKAVLMECLLDMPWRTKVFGFVLAGLLLASLAQAGEVTQGMDNDARLPFWQWQEQAMSLRLVQRLPDQTRSFFMARGFDSETANVLGLACVFQVIFRNDTPDGGVVELDLANWRVVSNGQRTPLKTKPGWDQEWRQRGLSESARIAFRWAFFPSRQQFGPADYGWGMIAFGQAPGTSFDLELDWSRNGISHTVSIADMRCAPDIHPEGNP